MYIGWRSWLCQWVAVRRQKRRKSVDGINVKTNSDSRFISAVTWTDREAMREDWTSSDDQSWIQSSLRLASKEALVFRLSLLTAASLGDITAADRTEKRVFPSTEGKTKASGFWWRQHFDDFAREIDLQQQLCRSSSSVDRNMTEQKRERLHLTDPHPLLSLPEFIMDTH